MDHEDAESRAEAHKLQPAPPYRSDHAEIADRAAEAATELYVVNEHEQRKRRFEIALARAVDTL